MISRLHGVVLERDPQRILLDVEGVGYEVEIPLSTFYQLAEIEGPTIIHTHFVVRQDAQLLYGFASIEERELFRMLIRVSGVGPKTALAVLSGLEIVDFIRAVKSENKKTLAGIPGVSQRNAEHIIADMRGRIDSYTEAGETTVSLSSSDIAEDAESALVGLGYKQKEAAKALAEIDEPALDLESLIRQALKQLVKG